MSDLHLGAGYIQDKRAHEQRIVRFLDAIATDATALYLLGDIIDYWFEYRHVVPRGYVRFFGKLASLADAGVKVVWFTGNHDVWLRDYLRDEIGLEVYYGHTTLDINGTRFLLSHGDDVGRQPAMYRFTRWCFYNKVCQTLYATLHPRWTAPIALGWSKQNRTSRDPEAVARRMDECAQNLVDFSTNYARRHPDVKQYVYGHIHLARQIDAPDGVTVTILGDWITRFTYATFDGNNVALHTFDE